MIKVGVVGGTGYTGIELLRLLLQHPQVELTVVTSRSEAGTALADVYPNLRGFTDAVFQEPALDVLADNDLVFFATPNGVAMEMTPALLEAGVKVIDLAADFRLKDVAVWEQWYGQTHACPALLEEAVYGLPEISREQIAAARLVANPGCYPTSIQLGFLPLLEAGCIDESRLIADAKSGVSGAGRQAKTHIMLAEAADSFKAYGASGHRHLPELQQGLAAMTPEVIGLTFVPHLLPIIRGIHATLYATVSDPNVDIQALYEARYADERFVDVMPPGSHPETRSVRGSNRCRIAIHRQPGSDQVVVLSVIDNLVKGAAGQAIQNMNIMFGLDEHSGLLQVPLLP